MSTDFPTPPFSRKNLGRITVIVAACLAAAVMIRVGTTVAFSERVPAAQARHLGSMKTGEIRATHGLPIAEDAQTYDEANPQPPSF